MFIQIWFKKKKRNERKTKLTKTRVSFIHTDKDKLPKISRTSSRGEKT